MDENENDKGQTTMTTTTPTSARPKKPFQNTHKNIVGPGEVDSDLKSEVVQECQKYGKILDSKIIDISEKNNDNVDETDAVRIFLKFSSIADSQSAVTGLNQRIFGGRVLYSAFFDVAKFDRGELDGLC